MGLFDGDDLELDALLEEAEKLASKYPSYIGDLNEGTVQAIFNRCLATADTKEYIKSVLEQQKFGFAQDSKGILFDRVKIQRDNIHAIEYLYGQLLTAHDDSNSINTSTKTKVNAMTKYTGEIWTTNKGILMQFFHLGLSANTIYPFTVNFDSSFTANIRPTLSPKDPAFPAWWEAHRSEWEM